MNETSPRCGARQCIIWRKTFYRFSAFFSEDTRRRDTGIFSSTPFSVSSSVPPETDSISSTIDRFTR